MQNHSNNVFIILHLLPVVCFFLSAIFIFVLRGSKRITNYISFARLGVSVFLAVNIYQYYNTPYYMLTLWNPIHLLTILTSYPLLFAYLFRLMRPKSISYKYWLGAYIPLGILVVMDITFRIAGKTLPPFTDHDQLWQYHKNPLLWLRFTAAILWIIEVAVFGYWGLKMQYQHRLNLTSDFSYTEGAGLGWVRWIIFVMLCDGIVALLAVSFEGIAFKVVAMSIMTVESIITTSFVLRQRDLYRQSSSSSTDLIDEVIENKLIEFDENKIVEQSSQKRELLKQNLLQLLSKDEIFKDPELSSEKVREMLFTNRTYLSQIINHDLGTNFYNLVNNYRVKKAEEMMKDPLHKNMPLKNIAEICGFKSFASFSTLFKQTYNQSPSEWRKIYGFRESV